MSELSPMAPIVLFCYMRPEHLARTVASLLRNPEAAQSHLTVYCDAPKKADHQEAVDSVRRYVESITGFATITRVYRSANMGLARSIIEGVTDMVRLHGRVIVLEDDLVLSPFFLDYMNRALALYQDDPQVASIHGYCYPVSGALPDTFFLKGADCWGWATWSRAWAHFEPDSRHLLQQLRQRNLCREFDLDGSYPYTRMLRGQIAGRNDSWAIRWHASCFLKGMLTLYPGRTLVENIGTDGSGTHGGPTDVFAGALNSGPVPLEKIALEASPAGRAGFVGFFNGTREDLFQKVKRTVSKRLRDFR